MATDQQNRAHARLSGSVASIFTKCTGAPALWEGRIRKATAHTREGTAAHEIAEMWLVDGYFTPPKSGTLIVEGEEVEITDEMVHYVGLFVSLIQTEIARSRWHAIEQQFDMDRLWHPNPAPEPMFGSADFAGVFNNVLTIIDLKFGKGVLVSAEANAQILYYALGVWLWLSHHHPELAQFIDTVRLVIVQPRVDERPQEWTVPLLDLLMWGEGTLKRAVDDIHAGRTSLVAGTHCQFCTAKGACPELARVNMDLAKGVFPPLEPTVLSDDELDEILGKAELLSSWVNGVRAEMETRIKNSPTGRFKNWKLVAKRGLRQWTDPEVARDVLSQNLVHPFHEPDMLSPAQAQGKLNRRVGAAKANEIVASLVTIPETGTTLVPSDDPRPAVETGPQAAFSSVI